MIHNYEGLSRRWPGRAGPGAVAAGAGDERGPEGRAPGGRIASSILDGLLLLEDGLAYQVVDLPLPREWTPLLQEGQSPSRQGPPERNAAEKREILERLGDTGRSAGWAASRPWPNVRGGCDRDHSPQPVPWR